RQIDLRNRYGLTLLAVKRGQEVISNPPAQTKLCAGDILVLWGTSETLAKASELFQ
ncbi:MAG: TrkA C-terminal domain-containing protein, partial [Firmicutes bacterium]|nr:TrkA C-terminal domain-containing protein [Bacillota bacterium]